MKDMWLLLANNKTKKRKKVSGWDYSDVKGNNSTKVIIFPDYREPIESLYYYNTEKRQSNDITVMDNVNLNGLYSLFDLSDIKDYQNGGYYVTNGIKHPFTIDDVVIINETPYLKNKNNDYISLIFINKKESQYIKKNTENYVLISANEIDSNNLLYGGTITLSDKSEIHYNEDDLVSVGGTVYIKAKLPSQKTITSFTANGESFNSIITKSLINLDGINGYLSGGKINYIDGSKIDFIGSDVIVIDKTSYIFKDNTPYKEIKDISILTNIEETTISYDGSKRCKTAIPFTSYPEDDSIYQFGGDINTDIPIWDQIVTSWDSIENYYEDIPWLHHSDIYSFPACSLTIAPSGTLDGARHRIKVPHYVYDEDEDYYVYSYTTYDGEICSPNAINNNALYTPVQALKAKCSTDYIISEAEYKNKKWFVGKCNCRHWKTKPLESSIYYPTPEWYCWALYQQCCDGWKHQIQSQYVIVRCERNPDGTFSCLEDTGKIGWYCFPMDFCCKNKTKSYTYYMGGASINGKIKIGSGCIVGLVGKPWRLSSRPAPGPVVLTPDCEKIMPEECDCSIPKLYDYYIKLQDFYIHGGGGCSKGAATSNSIVVSRFRYIPCTSRYLEYGYDSCAELGESYVEQNFTNYIKGCGNRYSIRSGLIRTSFNGIVRVKRGVNVFEIGAWSPGKGTEDYSKCCCGSGTDFSIGVTNSNDHRRCISLPSSVSSVYSGMTWTVYELNYGLTYDSGVVGANGKTGAAPYFCSDLGYNGYMRIRIECK